jgi:hypothetical protein
MESAQLYRNQVALLDHSCWQNLNCRVCQIAARLYRLSGLQDNFLVACRAVLAGKAAV